MELTETLALRQAQRTLLYAEMLEAYEYLHDKYTLQKTELIEYKAQANYWSVQFKDLKSREIKLQQENEELKAALRKREQQLFGKSSESGSATSESNKSEEKPLKRGQQAGKKGHGKRSYQHLPAVIETIALPSDESQCPCCGLAYNELPSSEDSEIIETINVKAYRRVIRRKMYKRTCACPMNEAGNQIITAPVAPRLISKSRYGVSIWAMLLIKKYVYQLPLYRALKELSNNGLDIAMGSILDGWKKLTPLLLPIYNALTARNLQGEHWHADETGWKVFEMLEGKLNQRWFLWIFKGEDSVVYKLDPSRSSAVPKEYFGETTGGILSVDRYSAYKVIAKAGVFILAFCWAHVRRDFLTHAKGYLTQEDWALSWVDRIGKLYHINNERIRYNDVESDEFRKLDKQLKNEAHAFKQTLDKQLADTYLLPSAKKVLQSLLHHWSGLTIFLEHPHVPMDNNVAERGLRPCVIGRKNYYGSGAIWAGELATIMFSIVETLKCWQLNPHTWLLAYFEECALSGGVPDNIDIFLPWNMSDNHKLLFSKAPVGEESG